MRAKYRLPWTDRQSAQQIESSLLDVLSTAAAILALALFFLRVPLLPIAIVGGLALIPSLWASTQRRVIGDQAIRPIFTVPRVLLIILSAAYYSGDQPGFLPWLLALLMICVLGSETATYLLHQYAIPYGTRLPGVRARNRGVLGWDGIFIANTWGTLLYLGLSLASFHLWGMLAVLLITAIVSAMAVVTALWRIADRMRAEKTTAQRLREYQPAFVVYWDAPPGTEYQLAMWLPYLERLGKKFFVLLRNEHTFAAVKDLTTAPVLVGKPLSSLDAMVVPSLKSVFYVNNAVRNAHFVRYPQLKHIMLNHGDSDKAPSYNPVTRMYDKNFVAGQAAIDRFKKHDVEVNPEWFVIVGRPQVEHIHVGPRRSPGPRKTVLYAPTWTGYNADSNYTSLSVGYEIVESLLRQDCEVVFRPHPYTDKNTSDRISAERIRKLLEDDATTSGRAHRLGDEAERAMSMVDCFNSVDALIADVSSVISDFLYSEKPFAMAATWPEAEDIYTEFPIARGAYVIDRSLQNLDECIASLLGEDPLAAERRRLKAYYLGDFPADEYVDVFLREASKYI